MSRATPGLILAVMLAPAAINAQRVADRPPGTVLLTTEAPPLAAMPDLVTVPFPQPAQRDFIYELIPNWERGKSAVRTLPNYEPGSSRIVLLTPKEVSPSGVTVAHFVAADGMPELKLAPLAPAPASP